VYIFRAKENIVPGLEGSQLQFARPEACCNTLHVQGVGIDQPLKAQLLLQQSSDNAFRQSRWQGRSRIECWDGHMGDHDGCQTIVDHIPKGP